jgi:hypothetical protein
MEQRGFGGTKERRCKILSRYRSLSSYFTLCCLFVQLEGAETLFQKANNIQVRAEQQKMPATPHRALSLTNLAIGAVLVHPFCTRCFSPLLQFV